MKKDTHMDAFEKSTHSSARSSFRPKSYKSALNAKYVRENIKELEHSAKKRNSSVDCGKFEATDKKYRTFIKQTENLAAERRKISKEIGKIRGNLKVKSQ